MSDLPATTVSSFLSVLRTLPVWLLAGLALAGYAVLFTPTVGGIDLATFRTEWGIWVWIGALTFSILAVVRSIDASVNSYLARRRAGDRRALRLVPLQRECWWHLAKQRDDSFVSQISLHIEAANVTDRPVRIVKARLVRSAGGNLMQSSVLLPQAGSPYHSERHAVPPHGTATASLHMMVRGALAPQGRPLRAGIVLTDQFGDEYQVKKISVPSHDRPLPRQPWTTRLISGLRRLAKFREARRPGPDNALPPPSEWQHGGKFENVDLILNEERRNYAANGRGRGGLGSLDVTLQSEPNSGWTKGGTVPALLWEMDRAKTIESPNATRLLKSHAALDDAGKIALEQYLLSHLHKGSAYADVAYFIFFALHRMGQTVPALEAARSRLSGDKVFGYSNVLGTLSAIVSHEHAAIDPGLYPQIVNALAGDPEYNFRLIEKINLARIQQLDRDRMG